VKTLNRQVLYSVVALVAVLLVAIAMVARTVLFPPAGLVHLTLETPKPVPDAAFADDGGNMHHLSEFRGRFVLLNLWGTWCAPCAREMPSLARLSAAMPTSQFLVLAVALPPGNVKDIRAFLVAHQASRLAIYLDSRTMFVRSFKAYGVPVTVLIDRRGREIARSVGPEEWGSPESVAYIKSLTAIP
jgi:thiol-disulfide isomerase/thioredoxin